MATGVFTEAQVTEIKRLAIEAQGESGRDAEDALQLTAQEVSADVEGAQLYSLPGIKKDANGRLDSYVMAPLRVFMQPALDAAETAQAATESCEQATEEAAAAKDGVEQAVSDATAAKESAETAAASANRAAAAVETAIGNAESATASANAAAQNADQSRQQADASELVRVTAEQGRVTAETGRAEAESSRALAETGRADAEQSRQQQEQARQDATATAISNAESATAGAERVNAELDGMRVTVTNRQGVASSVNLAFDIYDSYPSIAAMQADVANIPRGGLASIATSDPTDSDNAKLYQKRSDGTLVYIGDLDQAAAQAWTEWLNTKKPAIDEKIAQAAADHTLAAADHATAAGDHTQAASDHTLADSDHTTAAGDHTQAGQDHTRAAGDHEAAASDHTQAESDSSRAATDHGTASADHTQAESDHSLAETDHTTASGDHDTAAGDHTLAAADHATADADHTLAGQDSTASQAATDAANAAAALANGKATYAEQQGDRAKAHADHPAYIGADDYWYLWDETTSAYVQGSYAKGDDLHYEEMTQQEKDELAQNVLSTLTFDSTPTAGSTNPVTSNGVHAALAGKQDSLEWASDAEAAAVWEGYSFSTTD